MHRWAKIAPRINQSLGPNPVQESIAAQVIAEILRQVWLFTKLHLHSSKIEYDKINPPIPNSIFHSFPMVFYGFPWLSHGFPMAFPWLSAVFQIPRDLFLHLHRRRLRERHRAATLQVAQVS